MKIGGRIGIILHGLQFMNLSRKWLQRGENMEKKKMWREISFLHTFFPLRMSENFNENPTRVIFLGFTQPLFILTSWISLDPPYFTPSTFETMALIFLIQREYIFSFKLQIKMIWYVFFEL